MSLARYNPKVSGEEAECPFMWQALRHGLVVSKPYGDSAPYDFIVDSGPYQQKRARLLRIQVRSAVWQFRGWYHVCAGQSHRKAPPTSDHADFLVAFVPAHHVWYVIPRRALGGLCSGIAFHPRLPTRSRWERYREAWHLLGGALRIPQRLKPPSRSARKEAPAFRPGDREPTELGL